MACHLKIKRESTLFTVLKPIICILVILLLINRYHFLHFENKVVCLVEGLLSFAVFWICVICLYVSAGDLLLIYEKKTKNNNPSDISITQSKQYKFDEIVFEVDRNDIIEFQILSYNRIVRIGSNSDYNNVNSKLFDKQYYIDDVSFKRFDDFKKELSRYEENGNFYVIAIDGVSVK